MLISSCSNSDPFGSSSGVYLVLKILYLPLYIVILGDLDDNTSASVSKQKDLAAFALTEINRIINQFGERVVG